MIAKTVLVGVLAPAAGGRTHQRLGRLVLQMQRAHPGNHATALLHMPVSLIHALARRTAGIASAPTHYFAEPTNNLIQSARPIASQCVATGQY